jgi:hypothetical protein
MSLARTPVPVRPARTLAGFLAALLLTVAGAAAASSTTPDAAPPFTGGAEAGRTITLSSLRGKPVILLIARSPRDRAFRGQLGELRGCYARLAAQGLLCFAAFTSEGGVIRSNIPFILVNDPAAAASSYDVQKGFAIAVIGRDGNLDCISTKPLPGQRILDLIVNNAGMQSLIRR